jgi:phospholipid transport system substrate-binding protein
MRYVFSTILCMFLLVAPVASSWADAPSEVRDLLKTKIDAVLVLLRDKAVDKAVDKAHRNEWISAIISPIFAYPTMAKLSLGKKHWSTLSAEQRATFSSLFIARLQESYLDKLNIYSDEEVSYGEPRSLGKKVQVPTTLLSKDNRIAMLYKFYRSATGWKIYDVEIAGVSVIQTYRAQFDGVLSTGTIDDLLKKLSTNGALDIPEPKAEGGRPGPE